MAEVIYGRFDPLIGRLSKKFCDLDDKIMIATSFYHVYSWENRSLKIADLIKEIANKAASISAIPQMNDAQFARQSARLFGMLHRVEELIQPHDQQTPEEIDPIMEDMIEGYKKNEKEERKSFQSREEEQEYLEMQKDRIKILEECRDVANGLEYLTTQPRFNTVTGMLYHSPPMRPIQVTLKLYVGEKPKSRLGL
jgi:hypothetical protein